jgi:hypothetical protein
MAGWGKKMRIAVHLGIDFTAMARTMSPSTCLAVSIRGTTLMTFLAAEQVSIETGITADGTLLRTGAVVVYHLRGAI